ncbi:TPA: hypothetical protein ACH3X2_008462 [Trebouxia sp. C0005]
MVELATSDWQELTQEILWKLVDVLQRRDTTVSAFASQQYLSAFKRVCPQWRQAAGACQRHLSIRKGSDWAISVLLDRYPSAQSLALPYRGVWTEEAISILRTFPRIRFLDDSRCRTALSLNELVQLEGVTTVLALRDHDQAGKCRLRSVCESLPTLKYMAVAEPSCHLGQMPADWQEKMNSLMQLKSLESLATRRVPSPACLAALTKLTRLELSCFDDRYKYHLNAAMGVVPSLTCLKTLWLGACPSVEQLQCLSNMPHLTSLDIESSEGRCATCSLCAVHRLCQMTPCKYEHAWSIAYIAAFGFILSPLFASDDKAGQRIRLTCAFKEQSTS